MNADDLAPWPTLFQPSQVPQFLLQSLRARRASASLHPQSRQPRSVQATPATAAVTFSLDRQNKLITLL